MEANESCKITENMWQIGIKEKKQGDFKCGRIIIPNYRYFIYCSFIFHMRTTVMSSWCLLESWEGDHPISFQCINVKGWDKPTGESDKQTLEWNTDDKYIS